MVIPTFIVPPSIKLSQTRLVCQSTGLVISAATSQKRSSCPSCHRSSRSIHSRYKRTFLDLPVSGKSVKVVIDSRKFLCKNKKCQRKIFTERFGSEIMPFSRSFLRSAEMVRKLGLKLGGNKGSAICTAIGYPISPSSILRAVKQISFPEHTTTSGTIGVDDWAYKKGRNYGTIIVDLGTRRVIDMLPDREAGTLAEWLKEHPEIHTVSRDRASAYSSGIRTGAPGAIQVADRFHLLVNLRDAFQNSLHRHGKVLKECFQEFSIPDKEQEGGDGIHNKVQDPVTVQDCPEDEDNGLFVGNVSPEKQYKFEKAKELSQKGFKIKAIAKALGANRKTIKKYIALETLTSREVISSRSMTNFSSFEPELIRLYLPNTTFLSLFNHITALGFNGKYTQFCERMNKLLGDGKKGKTKHSHIPKPVSTWSSSKLAFMALAATGKLKEEDQAFLDFLYKKSTEIRDTARLANSFKELFEAKEEGSLRAWTEKAKSPESGLNRFAKGIESDFEAVNQAVISTISNGHVEGQVNRLKTIKRNMYGRAGFNLLKKMVMSY